MSEVFKFKQFALRQHHAVMKVSTDGILLGAWAGRNHRPENILDIGAGTGLIALMLAQRSAAKLIDAIEPESKAYEQCVANFEASPWADRLFCYHAGLDDLIAEPEEIYDLIVSNPPFFTEATLSPDKKRAVSRNSHFLPFGNLLKGVSTLLSDKGSFSVILPFKEEEVFIQLAESTRLFPSRITRVRSFPHREFKRSLLEFKKVRSTILEEEMTIEKTVGEYHKDYVDLTREYYVKM